MRNCLILGSGRSGTSMLAGTLGGIGYYMGENLVVGEGNSNPKGCFEDHEINWTNEWLLTPVAPPHFEDGWRWLAAIPLGTMEKQPPLSAEIAEIIAKHTARSPFCFKDPRFCYTLRFWRPYLVDTVFLCVFREPRRTAHSILRECGQAKYLQGIDLDFDSAINVWTLMYRHILEIHRHEGEWLFVHYDQLLDGSAIARLEAMLGVQANREFPDQELSRSPRDGHAVGPAALRVYEQLCELADFRELDVGMKSLLS